MWGIEMDFEALRCFITVAETLNFRRASEQLFLSQPALSRKIAELEKALGAALLERDTRNVRLTPAGRACLGHARRILQDCAAMQAQVADIRRGIMGELMIGYHGRGNVPYLSAAIGRCMAQYPQIRINAALLETERLRQDLLAGEIDGVMILAPCIWDLQEMEHIVIARERPSVLLPAGHPLAGREAVELSDLREESFILYKREKSSHMFNAMLSLCARAGFAPNISATGDNNVPLLVASGKGVGLYPTTIHGEPEEPMGTVRIPLMGEFPGYERVFAWRKGQQNPCLPAFCQILREESAQTAD